MYSSFLKGEEKFGLQKKVCSDHGGENIEVWCHMLSAHSYQQCVIVGNSTHKGCVEYVLVIFGDLFRKQEDGHAQ